MKEARYHGYKVRVVELYASRHFSIIERHPDEKEWPFLIEHFECPRAQLVFGEFDLEARKIEYRKLRPEMSEDMVDKLSRRDEIVNKIHMHRGNPDVVAHYNVALQALEQSLLPHGM